MFLDNALSVSFPQIYFFMIAKVIKFCSNVTTAVEIEVWLILSWQTFCFKILLSVQFKTSQIKFQSKSDRLKCEYFTQGVLCWEEIKSRVLKAFTCAVCTKPNLSWDLTTNVLIITKKWNDYNLTVTVILSWPIFCEISSQY